MDAFDRAVVKQELEGARTGWLIHLAVYVAVQLMLAVTWWVTSQGEEVVPWFLFPLFGWGIGLTAHYFAYRSRLRALSRT